MRAVILQSAEQIIEWLPVVGHDLIELAQRDVVHKLPCFGAIVRHRQAAVFTDPYARRILRIHPHGVIIAVRLTRYALPVAPAVDRRKEAHCDRKHAVLIRRIHLQVPVIHAAPHHLRILGDHLEMIATIVGTVQRALVRLRNHVHHIRIARRHPHAHPSPFRSQTVGQALPSFAAIAGTINARLITAANELPRPPLKPPHCCIDDVGIHRIDVHVRRPVLSVNVEALRPGLASIGRHKDPSLFIWTRIVTQCRHIHYVGIEGIDGHS